ncbi:STAS domain-containing protein [Caulobacter sp. SLTY]|uniref:STAS domain-containing protein n=1 Tax=Caulobacter sp. SLTY TaxID=2683262 RepID=UPI0014134038|nr:STAS domain-containing protein [Caulobacter sp. SLTY]NBB15046.1 STAS domain-containing protein [Caulobacter sp. SLTY]
MSARSYTLPPVIDPASVGALRTDLLALRGEDLIVEGDAVQRIGGLGLQVLISAQRTWAADGHTLSLNQPSPSLIEMLRLTGAAQLPEFNS